MASFPYARTISLVGLLAAATTLAHGQGNFIAEGGEYGITGTLLGDQVYPQVSIRTSGGYLVWQDNITDGSGLGISARKLDGSLTGSLSSFRVNQDGAEDQERPCVSMLNDGGAIFVWEGGRQSFQHIYARIISSGGIWSTGDFLVNTATNAYQLESAVTTLTNGYAVVAWSSYNQVSSTSLRDVYFQILSPTGAKFGVEKLANQTTAYNQRSAALAALSDGRFVAVWISEQQRFENSVDVYGRIYTSAGSPVGNEFLINSGTNVCANPSVAPSPDGGFAVAWMENDSQITTNGWDVYMRPFSVSAAGGVTRRINTHLFSEQLAPKIAALDNKYFVEWTSMGQDGSREGVYGQVLNADGSFSGSEFRVNTTIVSQQMYPTLASDGVGRFLTVWASFGGGAASFDLYAQRYISTNTPLAAPAAPIVTVLNSSALSVSWPLVSGFSIANYEVYADGTTTATAAVTNTYWNATGLAAASTHSYRLAYVLWDGRRSPLSGSTTNTTYSSQMYSGVPMDWMAYYFGDDNWPSGSADSDHDGSSNKDEFLRGTDPTDANSVLRQALRSTPQGLFLDWNTIPGLMYQVEGAATPGGVWTNVGGPRFAAGTVDSIYVGWGNAGFYRVARLR